MDHDQKHEIQVKRKEIGKTLSRLLVIQGTPFTLDDIKATIYNEKSTADLVSVLNMFHSEPGSQGYEGLVELVREAWNYYPHKSLGGRSPREKSLE